MELKDYLKLKYPTIIGRIRRLYTIYSPLLGEFSCYGRGHSEKAAMKDFLKNKEDFIRYLYYNKKEIPIPEADIDGSSQIQSRTD